MGKHTIEKTKGFNDGIHMCRYNTDTEFFKNSFFNVLKCRCEDLSEFRKDYEFKSSELLQKYAAAVQAVQNFGNENGLEITTEKLDSDPIWYYEDFNVESPKYLERKVVKLSDNQKPYPKNILMIRTIHLGDNRAGLWGPFTIGVPADKQELFDYILNYIQLPIPPLRDARKTLLEARTDDLGMMQEIAGAIGFKPNASDFLR